MTPSIKSNESVDEDVSVIYLIRHGDRFDYANPEWKEMVKASGNLVTDPPLSALGHQQARETAKLLPMCDVILASPYVRVIQTACPTSDALGIPICIEDGLSEAHATPNLLPSPKERFAYFPQIDFNYKPILTVEASPGYKCTRTGAPCEAFGGHYVKRIEKFASRLTEVYRGQKVICFSHAASTVLVACLLKVNIKELKFAPCGIFQLQRIGDGPWEMVKNGNTNSCSENAKTTYPWGFTEKHFTEDETGKYQGSSEGIGLDYFVRS